MDRGLNEQGSSGYAFPGRKLAAVVISAVTLAGLYLSSFYNYLLFHTLVEIFSIVVACGIFMVAWNVRRILDNNYLLFLGIAFLFIAFLDLIHTLAYKGMPIFQGYGADLPTQLWIAARYMESLSLLIAPLFLHRRLKPSIVFSAYTALSVLLLVSLFHWHIFPPCFVEGVGLTPFKKISEYVISMILLGALAVLFKNRKAFDPNVFRLLAASIVITIVSELAFTFYVSVYGLSNLFGHFCKLISFYLIYKAIIRTGLQEPYNLLFKNLKQNERILQESEERFRAAFLASPSAIAISTRKDGVWLDVNQAALDVFGYTREEVIGKSALETNLWVIPEDRQRILEALDRSGTVRNQEVRLRLKNGSVIIASVSAQTLILNGAKHILFVTEDITEHRQAEEALREREYYLSTILETTRDGFWVLDIQGSVTDVNAAYCRMSGYTRDALLQMRIPDMEVDETPDETAARIKRIIQNGSELFETRHRRKDGSIFDVELSVTWMEKGVQQFVCFCRDITDRKRTEEALLESEKTVRKKLQAILEPEGNIGNLNLADIIDHQALQSMMEKFYGLTKIGGAIVDVSGKVLASVGWQDICAKFHRAHPETLKNCMESDTVLSSDVSAGSFKTYRCKNNMWDMVTPIEVGGRHLGNIFIGQFFYEGEIPDHELFRRQARRYGFDETEYLSALDRVPSWSRETIDTAMAFYAEIARMISSLSYSKIKLSRALSQQETALRRLGESDQALRESQANLSALIASTDDIIVSRDRNGCVIAFNEGFVRIVRRLFDIEAKPGVRTTDYLPDTLKTYWEHTLEEVLSGKSHQEEFTWEMDGEKRHYALSLNPIWEGDEVIGSAEFTRDITKRKREDKEREKLSNQLLQSQKMESIGRLAGGVAHDFNNKLGVILGFVQMILADMEPENPIYGDLEEVQDATKGAADLTRQLLAFARKQTIAPKELDFNETIAGMLKMLRRLIGEDIELTWQPDTNLWPVKMDPAQIDQILANLAVNARDSIDGVGKIGIETKNRVLDDAYCAKRDGAIPGEFVMLAVSDNGCGMEKEILDQIFEPFFTTKGVGKGTGLGLSTVYGIVKQNDGFVNAYSEPGKGTTFKIYIPRYQGGPALETVAGLEETPRGDGETILLVEDDPGILRMARMMLERLGYAVLTASSPL